MKSSPVMVLLFQTTRFISLTPWIKGNINFSWKVGFLPPSKPQEKKKTNRINISFLTTSNFETINLQKHLIPHLYKFWYGIWCYHTQYKRRDLVLRAILCLSIPCMRWLHIKKYILKIIKWVNLFMHHNYYKRKEKLIPLFFFGNISSYQWPQEAALEH